MRIFRWTLPLQKTTVLPDAEDRTTVSSFRWTKHRNVTDRSALDNTALCIASNADGSQCGRAVKIDKCVGRPILLQQCTLYSFSPKLYFPLLGLICHLFQTLNYFPFITKYFPFTETYFHIIQSFPHIFRSNFTSYIFHFNFINFITIPTLSNLYLLIYHFPSTYNISRYCSINNCTYIQSCCTWYWYWYLSCT